MRRLAYALPLALFAAVAAWFATPILRGTDPSVLPSALVGGPAPAVALPPLLDSKPGIDAAGLAGGPLLVNFFASWCVPCRAEHPLLMRLAAAGTVPLLGVSYKDAPADAIGWLAELGDPFARIGRDDDGRAAIEWGVYGVPETFVVDRAGRVRHRHAGPMTRRVLEEDILPLLAEPGGEAR